MTLKPQRLKLEEKGPIKSAPVLAGQDQKTVEAIQSWPNIILATPWNLFNRSLVNGTDFYVGEAELGHIHLHGDVHLATTTGLGVALLKQNLSSPFPYGYTAAAERATVAQFT